MSYFMRLSILFLGETIFLLIVKFIQYPVA